MENQTVIQESTQYDKFIPMDTNRDIYNLKDLMKSMQKHGWLVTNPMHVIRRDDGKYIIKQGHNRFVAATRLKIPVLFVEGKDVPLIDLEGPGHGRWSLADFFNSYCRAGNPEYLKVKKYIDKTGIFISSAAGIMANFYQGSAQINQKIKDGTYKTAPENEMAEKVAEVVILMRDLKILHATSSGFLKALCMSIAVPEFDIEIFLKKTKRHKDKLEPQATLKKYLESIEWLYNYHESVKIPLSFKAITLATNKNKSKRKK